MSSRVFLVTGLAPLPRCGRGLAGDQPGTGDSSGTAGSAAGQALHGAGLGGTAPGLGAGGLATAAAGRASKDHTVLGSVLWPLRSSLILGCLQQRLRLHTHGLGLGFLAGLWQPLGCGRTGLGGTGSHQLCSEESQELRTESWPCGLLAPGMLTG